MFHPHFIHMSFGNPHSMADTMRLIWFRQLDLAPFDTFIWPHPLISPLDCFFNKT
jgi:hypothetical protein